jgi:hypothetical protein
VPEITKSDRFENKYSYKIDKEIIHIYGELNNPHNPVIFGYGDELDDDRIERLNDISWNFTNKTVMRERVVNKKYCVPLIEN